MRSAALSGEYHQAMRTVSRRAIALGAIALGMSVGACGSGTKTVSVGGAPETTQTQPQQSATAPKSGTAHTTPAPAGRSPSPATSTRTASEPAFTGQEHGGTPVSAAAAVLRAKGFTPTNTADYHPQQALEVLIGMHSGSGDGYGQQAFFFVNGRYIGTDTSQPSAALRVLGQGDTEVTLSYPLYRRGEPLCCPSGGHARVRFQLNNGKLTPLDPIPPLESKTGFSRY